MPLSLKKINTELAERGYNVRLERGGSGYFYFLTGEAAEWLHRTVQVPTISSLSLDQWIEEFERLKSLNAEIMRTSKKRSP
jgi:hypothetical protein